MNRLAQFSLVAAVALPLVSCGSSDDGALDTLPPIRTSSTSSTSSTTINPNRIFYTVKSGENLNLIARHFQVPLRALIDLNDIDDPNSVAAGVTLEIPTGVQEIAELPTTVETSEP